MLDFAWRPTKASPTYRMLADEFAEIYPSAATKGAATREGAVGASGDEPAPAEGIPSSQPELNKKEDAAVAATGQPGTPEDANLAALDAITKKHLERGGTALCLSGGGIRSAAFSLGVIQWLAKAGLLEEFKYLSTVSGGGYIGSWLSTWIAKAPTHWAEVKERIIWEKDFHAEPEEIRHLRENSSYLTPRRGLMSGDTWAAVGITLRNLFLNWLLILPLIAAIAILPKVVLTALWYEHDADRIYPFAILAFVSYAACIFVLAFNRPRWADKGLSRAQSGWFVQVPIVVAAIAWAVAVAGLRKTTWAGVAPVYVVGLFFLYVTAWASAVLWWRFGPGDPLAKVHPAPAQLSPGRLQFLVTLSRPIDKPVIVEVHTEDRQACQGVHFTAIPVAKRHIIFEPGSICKSVFVDLHKGAEIDGKAPTSSNVRLGLGEMKNARPMGPRWRREAARDVVFAGIRGVIVALLLASAHDLLASNDRSSAWPVLAALMFGMPAAIGSHLAGAILFTGLNSTAPRSESDREWHGRIDGVTFALALGWMVWWGVELILPWFLFHPFGWKVEDYKSAFAAISAIGGAAGTVTAWLGQSAKTSATCNESGADWKTKLVLPLIGIIFLVCLFASFSLALDWVFTREGLYRLEHRSRPGDILDGSLVGLGLVVVLVIAPIALGFFININRFSLHSIYRNRLIRAFLGASFDRGSERRRPTRKRTDEPEFDRLTGFNEHDNIELQRLWKRRDGTPRDETKHWRPFHIINIALNVVSGTDMSLKDRKALPFVATPLWCGSAGLENGVGAFRRSSEFGGEEKTITVGTAMAISGAAVSPNMGYNSSPIVSLILTLFNVRLGWWYGNPVNDRTYRREGPFWALRPLIYEAFGLTDTTRPYVYLSDGGHFDNLGLYEMIRRRCRFIVVVDAGQDGACAFDDLSNSVARIKTDFGISITFDLSTIRVRNPNRFAPKDGGDGFALGTIHYKDVHGHQAENGRILYVKPPLRGDEPPSILGYANKSPTFPHESTGNQQFTELQFESYRALGYETMRRLAASSEWTRPEPRDGRKKPDKVLEGFFDALSPWPRQPKRPPVHQGYNVLRARP